MTKRRRSIKTCLVNETDNDDDDDLADGDCDENLFINVANP